MIYNVLFTFHIRKLWNCPITPCIFEKEKSLQCSLNGLARAATTRSPIGMTCRETREPWPAWETVCVVLVNLRPPANLMNLFLIGLRSQFLYMSMVFPPAYPLISLWYFDHICLASSQVLILPQKWLLQGSQWSGTTASWETKNCGFIPGGDFVPLLR